MGDPAVPLAVPKSRVQSPTDTLVGDQIQIIPDTISKALDDEELRTVPTLSTLRRYTLLLIFCLSQFLDAFNNSALFPAIPIVAKSLNMTSSEQVWIFSAFQLTFASFLLIVCAFPFSKLIMPIYISLAEWEAQ